MVYEFQNSNLNVNSIEFARTTVKQSDLRARQDEMKLSTQNVLQNLFFFQVTFYFTNSFTRGNYDYYDFLKRLKKRLNFDYLCFISFSIISSNVEVFNSLGCLIKVTQCEGTVFVESLKLILITLYRKVNEPIFGVLFSAMISPIES